MDSDEIGGEIEADSNTIIGDPINVEFTKVSTLVITQILIKLAIRASEKKSIYALLMN